MQAPEEQTRSPGASNPSRFSEQITTETRSLGFKGLIVGPACFFAEHHGSPLRGNQKAPSQHWQSVINLSQAALLSAHDKAHQFSFLWMPLWPRARAGKGLARAAGILGRYLRMLAEVCRSPGPAAICLGLTPIYRGGLTNSLPRGCKCTRTHSGDTHYLLCSSSLCTNSSKLGLSKKAPLQPHYEKAALRCYLERG